MSDPTPFPTFITEMVVVYIDFNLWTGKISFDSLDYQYLNSGVAVNLPNSEQGSLGNKKIVDPEELKPFSKCKANLNAALLEKGLPFVGGVLIPANSASEIRHRLQQTEQTFEKLVSDFVANYPKFLEAWAQRNPEISYAGAPDQDEVAKRFAFKYHLYKLGAVQELGEDESIEQLQTSIRSTFYIDIVKKAKALYDGFVYSRPYGVPGFIKGMTKFRDKLMGLAFLNAEVKKLVELFDQHVLMNVDDKTSQLNGQAWITAAAILRMISDMNDLECFLDGQVTYTDYLKQVEAPILRAQKIFEDLKKLDMGGKLVTPALVYKICMGIVPMPTGRIVTTSNKQRIKRQTPTSGPKASMPKVQIPTLPLNEPEPMIVPTAVRALPPKAEPSPMDILNGLFG